MASTCSTMERAFYDIHLQTCSVAMKYTSARVRYMIEQVSLVVSVSVFCAVILSHRQYIYRGGAMKQQSFAFSCLQSIPGFQPDVDITHVRVIHNHNNHNNQSLFHHHTNNNPTNNNNKSIQSWVCHNSTNWEECFSQQYSKLQHQYSSSTTGTSTSATDQNKVEQCENKNSNNGADEYYCESMNNNLQLLESSSLVNNNNYYTFSRTKGLMYLSSSSSEEQDSNQQRYHCMLSTQHIVVSSQDQNCFGNDPFVLYLVHNILGYDTITINWLLQLANGEGFLYVPKSKAVLDLGEYLSEYTFRMSPLYHQHTQNQQQDHHPQQQQQQQQQNFFSTNRWHHEYFIFKLGVLLSSLFLFFLTTTLVSFTLRETQNRMLHFALQLQYHVRQRRPFAKLIISHIVENMVFVPIMIGMVFFLMDCFYNGDKLLAFMVISGVWVCETYAAVCLRSFEGMTFFPKAFFLYFTLFHVYCFSCPFGFIYLSLASTCFFLLHLMIFFWNRYELPAIVSGQITRESPRVFMPVSTSIHQQIHRPNSFNSIADRYGQSYPSMNSLGMISNASGRHGNVILDSDNDEDPIIQTIGGELVMQRGQDNFSSSRASSPMISLSRASSPMIPLPRSGSRTFSGSSTLRTNNTTFSSSNLNNSNNNNNNNNTRM